MTRRMELGPGAVRPGPSPLRGRGSDRSASRVAVGTWGSISIAEGPLAGSRCRPRGDVPRRQIQKGLQVMGPRSVPGIGLRRTEPLGVLAMMRSAGLGAGWARLRRSVAPLVLIAGLLGAAPVTAQSITMRSGEHAAFTRLTLPVPPGQSWQVGRTDDGYGVRLPDLDAQIDTSGVFARIPRSRLADLRPVAQGIDLVLGCTDCHANAFHERGLLVIDIRNGAPPQGARFEARLTGARVQPRPLGTGFDWTERFASAPVIGGVGQAGDEEDGLPVLSLYDQAGPARDLLARQFARAAAQGLIGAGSGPTPRRGLDPNEAQEVLDLAEAALRNLRIDAQTGLDRARQTGQRVGTDRDGNVCPADHLFDVAAWADARPIARQIAHRRDGLLAEFDRPVPDAVKALARLYIHAGFGAEAVDLLTTMPQPDQGLLLEMAQLLDDVRPLAESTLATHAGCDGPVALWAVLASEDLRTAGVIDRDAVRRAFSSLPRNLRRHLGPELAQRFIALGDTDTAQAIRSAMTRSDGADDGDGIQVLDAVIEMAQGRPEAASARVAPAAAGHSVGAAEALAVMAEARIAAGLPIAPGTLNDLIALAQEHRGAPLGQRLVRLEALALTDEGRFDAAFAARDRLRRQPDGAAAAERLTHELIARLSLRAGDEALLRRAFAEPVWRGGQLPLEARAPLADRLLNAGFPEDALDVFAQTDPVGDEAAVVMARAAIALDRPGQALRALAGREGSEAIALRADALLAMGDHQSAAGIFRDAGQADAALRASWLGGNWAEVARHAEGEDGLLAARAEQSQATTSSWFTDIPNEAGTSDMPWAPVPSEGALAEARALLDASADLRALVEGALAAHPAPDR